MMAGQNDQTRWEDLKQRLQRSTLAVHSASSRNLQRKADVYHQRAATLAAPREGGDSVRATTPTLVFLLGEQRYGVPLRSVARVSAACSLTPVPHTPTWVLGIANFQSRILPVIDVAELLGLPTDRPQPPGSFLLLRSVTATMAMRVDRIEDVQKLDLDQAVVLEQHSTIARNRFVCGVVEKRLMLLDVEKLLAYAASSGADPA